jgi:hypothetical protein
MPIQVPAVQGRPASVRPPDPVGDDQVGVQQRVAFSGRPVVEPHGHQTLAVHVLDTAMATTSPHMLVQVSDRLGQPGMVRPQHRPAGGRITEPIENRHALGRTQDHVEGGHRVAAMGQGPGVLSLGDICPDRC